MHLLQRDWLISRSEHVTRHRRKKPDFDDLVMDYVPYKPRYIGNVLFNGKLSRANSNYGCFMTLNTQRSHEHIPDNIRLIMRPVALVVPEYKNIIEATLFMNGYQKYKPLASKLHLFFDMLRTQVLILSPLVKPSICEAYTYAICYVLAPQKRASRLRFEAHSWMFEGGVSTTACLHEPLTQSLCFSTAAIHNRSW